MVLPTMQFTGILLVMMRPGRFRGHVRTCRFPRASGTAAGILRNGHMGPARAPFLFVQGSEKFAGFCEAVHAKL
jgi:hypothetical protein